MKGRIVLLTGVTGAIGGAIARRLENEGATLILVARNIDKLKNFAKDNLINQHILFELDLQNIKEIENLAREVQSLGVKIDGIIHAAGIGEVRPLKLTNPKFMEKMFNINFFSFVEFVRCFSSIHLKNDQLNIVGISAIGAYQGNSTKTAYSASKAAMNAAVRCLAIELADKGIRINTIAPGATHSNMVSDLLNLDGGEESLKKIKERQVLGICNPEDIAEGVIFLLSSASKMITGICLPIDGGKSAT